jgi:DNA replication protein DnaC
MANRRMIGKSISLSDQVNSMPVYGQLLFTWMVPHADDWGRMRGKPSVVKATVVPLHDVTLEQIDECLNAMAAARLILRYVVDGEQFICFPKWDQHQTGLHKRVASKIPPPPVESAQLELTEAPDELIPGSSRKFPEVPGSSGIFPRNITELNLTEQKGTEGASDTVGSASAAPPSGEAHGLLSKLCPMSDRVEYHQMLDGMIEDHGPGVVIETLKDMQARSIRSPGVMPYLRKALTEKAKQARMEESDVGTRTDNRLSEDEKAALIEENWQRRLTPMNLNDPQRLLAASGLSISDRYRTLQTFEPQSQSEFEAARQLVRAARRHGKPESFFIWGSCGVGKSHLAKAYALELMLKQIGVCYWNMAVWVEQLRQSWHNDDVENPVRAASECPVLVLDDIDKGTWSPDRHETVWSQVYRLLEIRANDRRPMVITANMPLTGIEKHFGKAISDRLGYCTQIHIQGESRRRPDAR